MDIITFPLLNLPFKGRKASRVGALLSFEGRRSYTSMLLVLVGTFFPTSLMVELGYRGK